MYLPFWPFPFWSEIPNFVQKLQVLFALYESILSYLDALIFYQNSFFLSFPTKKLAFIGVINYISVMISVIWDEKNPIIFGQKCQIPTIVFS